MEGKQTPSESESLSLLSAYPHRTRCVSAGRAAPPRGLWPGPEWSESWEQHRSAQQTRRSKRMQAASLSWRWLAQICGASSSDRELTISGLWGFRQSTEDARMDLCRTRDAAQFQEDRENAQCSKSIASGRNAKTQTGQLPWPLPLQNGQLRDKGPATLQLAQEPCFLNQTEPDSPTPSTQRILMHWGQCSQRVPDSTLTRIADTPIECQGHT